MSSLTSIYAKIYELLMDKLEDFELAVLVKSRSDQEKIEVTLEDL